MRVHTTNFHNGSLKVQWKWQQLVAAASAAASTTSLQHMQSGDRPLLFIAISVCLVALAGLMSGLTLGLLSINEMELEVLKRSGSDEEKKSAGKIVPLLKRPHHLLISLVLANAVATEALPICLSKVINPVAAVAASIVVVLIFGEVLPQAACTKYGLAIGARSAWFVKGLMCVTAPIAWPCSQMLSWVLGEQKSSIMRRRQLKVLVQVHGTEEGLGGTLTPDEIFVIQGALDLSRKSAAQACTPLDKVFMVSSEAVLDGDTLQAILGSGHSRIPVYRGQNRQAIIGAFLVKELAWLDKSSETPVASLTMRSIPTLPAAMPCYDLLRLFQTGRSHMAILVQPPEAPIPQPSQQHGDDFSYSDDGQVHLRVQAHHDNDSTDDDEDAKMDLWKRAVRMAEEADQASGVPIGIITLEDILEELLQREIVDETDQYIDNERNTRVDAAQILESLPPRLRKIVQGTMFKPRVGRLASLPNSFHGRQLSSARSSDLLGASSGLMKSLTIDENGNENGWVQKTLTRANGAVSNDRVSQADVRAAIDALTPLLDTSGPEESC